MTMPAEPTADGYLVQLLQEAGRLTMTQIDAARERVANECPSGGEPLSVFRELVRAGEIDEAGAMELLAARFGMKVVDLNQVVITSDALERVTREQAVQYRLLPVALRGGVLQVAVADPLETEGVDGLSHLLGMTIETLIATPDQIVRAIDRHYGRATAEFADLVNASGSGPIAPNAEHALRVADDAGEADAPIIKLVQRLIEEAVAQRASDIHLEPLERRFRVRYRVDGVLIAAGDPPKRLQAAIISRVKIMAGISIAEKRLPQDGRIQIAVGGRSLDLRVSSLPTSHGESIVMRILDQQSLEFGLAELGFLADDRATFERLVAQPDGMVLVTGPTGSGKTTTLYSCLHAINLPDRKIITVEDPVEYQMSGVNQVPVRADVGMTFASALRAMLRQAPNVVMVGEMRDKETAEIAIHASLTGHLVFSTLHTNDAPGAVTRLIDIGVKAFLVSTSLRGVMAQRLVRKICPQCGEAHQPTPSELRQLGLTPAMAEGGTFRRGRGCEACHGTGYRGRMGIFEILVMDDDLRQLIHTGASGAKLRGKARVAGMRTLREDGIRKVIAGLTTVEEIVSITVGDVS